MRIKIKQKKKIEYLEKENRIIKKDIDKKRVKNKRRKKRAKNNEIKREIIKWEEEN